MRSTCERELEDARYEADRLRDQLERYERAERDREREREEQRKEQRRQNDPSNRLYNGDVTDFYDAVRCHISCLQREITHVLASDSEELQDCTRKCNETMREGMIAANKAREIYERVVTNARKNAAAEMRAAGLSDWADCVESGDYSRMAI